MQERQYENREKLKRCIKKTNDDNTLKEIIGKQYLNTNPNSKFSKNLYNQFKSMVENDEIRKHEKKLDNLGTTIFREIKHSALISKNEEDRRRYYIDIYFVFKKIYDKKITKEQKVEGLRSLFKKYADMAPIAVPNRAKAQNSPSSTLAMPRRRHSSRNQSPNPKQESTVSVTGGGIVLTNDNTLHNLVDLVETGKSTFSKNQQFIIFFMICTWFILLGKAAIFGDGGNGWKYINPRWLTPNQKIRNYPRKFWVLKKLFYEPRIVNSLHESYNELIIFTGFFIGYICLALLTTSPEKAKKWCIKFFPMLSQFYHQHQQTFKNLTSFPSANRLLNSVTEESKKMVGNFLTEQSMTKLLEFLT